MFELLRELVRRSERDPEARIRELEKSRDRIDAEIERVRSGNLDTLDPTQVKERFFQIEDTARRLLGDFRRIEANFRELDREVRQKIAAGEKNKGSILDEIFTEHDVIRESDQGRSFRAFWEFMMSPARQEELAELLGIVYTHDVVRSLAPDPFLAKIKFALMDAAEKVHRTNSLLAEQLRKFLDTQASMENRRIMELIRAIEKIAVERPLIPGIFQDKNFMTIDDMAPDFDLVMSRGLFVPPNNPVLSEETLMLDDTAVDLETLCRQFHIDEQALRNNVRTALRSATEISLVDLIDIYPVKKGLGEVVGYLTIAGRDPKAEVSDVEFDLLPVVLSRGREVSVRIPKTLFRQ